MLPFTLHQGIISSNDYPKYLNKDDIFCMLIDISIFVVPVVVAVIARAMIISTVVTSDVLADSRRTRY